MIKGLGLITFQKYGISYDSDAQSFFTTTGITDITIKSAINSLVLSAKSNGWWSKCYVIYPFVGGSSTTCSYNLKNTAQYQILWSGTSTFSSTGVKSNGTTGYGNTGFNPNSILTYKYGHISTYLRNAQSSTEIPVGVRDGSGDFDLTITQFGYLSFFPSPDAYTSLSPVTTTGLMMGVDTNGVVDLYRNGSSVSNSNSGNGGFQFPNASVYVLARNDNGTAASFSNQETAFVTMGIELTSTDANNMYTDIQNFQTAIGRQV